jgi:hypothetical protein
MQGQLQEWTEHSSLIFENLKPVEIIKKSFQHHFNILKHVVYTAKLSLKRFLCNLSITDFKTKSVIVKLHKNRSS